MQSVIIWLQSFAYKQKKFKESDKKYAEFSENGKFYQWISVEVQIMGMRDCHGSWYVHFQHVRAIY